MGGLTDREKIDLVTRFPGAVFRGIELSALSQWEIGGPADIIMTPFSKGMLADMLSWLNLRGIKPVVIGLTTNLLFDSNGLRIPCIQIGSQMSRASIDGTSLNAQAGLWVPKLARIAMLNGLSGIEHTCGIPGSLGGLVCMNGGSNRASIGDVVVEVGVVDSAGSIRRQSAAECYFTYRASRFQESGEIITDVQLRLKFDRRTDIRSRMLEILESRRMKFPRKIPNCGSVFKSNPSMYEDVGPPGRVIEELGLKGRAVGGAKISPLHANFITNMGNASSSDVLELVAIIRDAVSQRTGYLLESEVRYVSVDGIISPV